MTEKEFLEKYGDENVYFTNTYKRGITYRNEELGITVYGVMDYRDDMSYEETIRSVSYLEGFYFTFDK